MAAPCGVPLAWFPRLLHGSAEQRKQVEISSRGLHREGLGEDISITGLLAGKGDQTRSRLATRLPSQPHSAERLPARPVLNRSASSGR